MLKNYTGTLFLTYFRISSAYSYKFTSPLSSSKEKIKFPLSFYKASKNVISLGILF